MGSGGGLSYVFKRERRVGGADQSIRIEVGGDLHEFGKLGKLVSVKEAEELA